MRQELTDSKGRSYGLHELGNGSNDWQESGDDASGGCILRTFEQSKTSNASFLAAGETDVLNFNNCKHAPLNLDSGTVIDHVSTTPLHVSLGLGLDNVNIIENLAIEIDKEIKAADGLTSDNMKELLQQRTSIIQQLQDLTDEETLISQQISDIDERNAPEGTAPSSLRERK